MLITEPKQANYLQPCKHYSAMGMKTSPFALLTDSKILELQKTSMGCSVQWTEFQDNQPFSTTYCMKSLRGLRPLLISMRGAIKLQSANTLHKWSMCKAAAATLRLTVTHNMAASQNYSTKNSSPLLRDYMKTICIIDYLKPTRN